MPTRFGSLPGPAPLAAIFALRPASAGDDDGRELDLDTGTMADGETVLFRRPGS